MIVDYAWKLLLTSYPFILPITTAIVISSINTQLTPTAIATIIIFAVMCSSFDVEIFFVPGGQFNVVVENV